MNRILFYGLWLFSTIGCVFLQEKEPTIDPFINVASNIVILKNDKINLAVNSQTGSIANIGVINQPLLSLKSNNLCDFIKINYEHNDLPKYGMIWKVIKHSSNTVELEHYNTISKKKSFRTITLQDNKFTISDNLPNNPSCYKEIIMDTATNGKTKFFVGNKSETNLYVQSFFGKNNNPIESQYITNNTASGFIGENKLMVISKLNSGVTMVKNIDYSQMINRNTFEKNNSVSFTFGPMTSKFLGENDLGYSLKYGNAWIESIPIVLDYLLETCCNIVNSPALQLLLFTIGIMIITLPISYLEYDKKKTEILLPGMNTLPSMWYTIGLILNIMIIYYAQQYVTQNNFSLNSNELLWAKTANSPENIAILNLFGKININLPFILKFGPLGILVSFIIAKYSKIDSMIESQYGKWFFYYFMAVLNTNFISVSTIFLMIPLTFIRPMIVEWLAQNNADIIRIK